MTAFTDKVNENNQWFNTPLPGRLSDVFGLKTNEFYRSSSPLVGKIGESAFSTTINFYEVLEPSTAKVLGYFSNVDDSPPVATVNMFGKGQAIYVATPAQPSIMQPLYRSLYAQLGIVPGPKTPEGVYARVVDDRVLYVNTTTEEKVIPLDSAKQGVLSGKQWSKALRLGANEVELLQ